MNDKTICRESFVFYRSFYDSISRCPDEVQIVLLRAVINYGLDGVVPDFSGAPYQQFVEAIFAGIRPQLDANLKRYLNGCEGGKFGHLGGAPKGNDNARKDKQPQNNPKTTPNDNVNVNDNENVNVSLGNQHENNGRVSLKLPFTSPGFVNTWNALVNEPGWRGKTGTALQMSLDELAQYDERFAIELMRTAIRNGNRGVVFHDTPARFEQWKQSHPTTGRESGKVITDINDLYKD